MAELSKRDKNRIRKHVTKCCANYSKEYGCLPLETECYMFSVGFTDSKLCKYYEQALLPTDAELFALFKGIPTKKCQQCGNRIMRKERYEMKKQQKLNQNISETVFSEEKKTA